jgi:hypothetical protein
VDPAVGGFGADFLKEFGDENIHGVGAPSLGGQVFEIRALGAERFANPLRRGRAFEWQR